MLNFFANGVARDIALTIIGLVVLLPLLYWQGRKRWLRGWTEEKVMLVGFAAFVLVVAGVAIYKNQQLG